MSAAIAVITRIKHLRYDAYLRVWADGRVGGDLALFIPVVNIREVDQILENHGWAVSGQGWSADDTATVARIEQQVSAWPDLDEDEDEQEVDDSPPDVETIVVLRPANDRGLMLTLRLDGQIRLYAADDDAAVGIILAEDEIEAMREALDALTALRQAR